MLRVTKIIFWLISKKRVICSCPPLFTAFEAVQFPFVAFCMRGSKLPDLSKNFVFGDHDADHRKGEEKVWDKCPFSEGGLFFCVRQIVLNFLSCQSIKTHYLNIS